MEGKVTCYILFTCKIYLCN